MKRLLSLALLLLPLSASAGGVQASFSGTRFDGLARMSTWYEWGTAKTAAGNLVDTSGENIVYHSNALGLWPAINEATITSDALRNPLTGAKDVDALVETATPGVQRWVAQNVLFSLVAGHTYTLSAYMTPISRRYGALGFYTGAAMQYAIFDLQTGSVTASSGAVTFKATPVTIGWYRVEAQFRAAVTNNLPVYVHATSSPVSLSYNGTLGLQAVGITNVQLVDNTDGFLAGAGIPHVTGALPHPRFDLTPNGTAGFSRGELQGSDGNRLIAEAFDGLTRFYRRSINTSFLNGDFTFTIVFRRLTSAGERFLFSKLIYNLIGIGFSTTGVNQVAAYAVRDGGGATKQVLFNTASTIIGGNYNVLQAVFRGNTLVMYVNGEASAVTDMTGYTTARDGSLNADVGGYGGIPAYYHHGDILYTRLDAEALSADDLRKDRSAIWGILAGKENRGWTFTRSTAAYSYFGTGGMALAAVGAPRVAAGLLIEPQSTNLIFPSRAFNASWTPTNASITNTSTALLLDGTVAGWNVLHEDATAGVAHDMTRTVYAAGMPSGTYTVSAAVRAVNRSWVLLQTTVGGTVYGSYFNTALGGAVGSAINAPTARIRSLGDGWYLVSITKALVGPAAMTVEIRAATGDLGAVFNGANQDSLLVDTVQVEMLPFPTTAITTVAAAAVRTADSMVLDPHPAATNSWSIPETFCGTCRGSKLEIEIDAQQLWWTSTGLQYELLTVSGSTGTASGTRNMLAVYAAGDQLFLQFYDNAGTQNTLRTTATIPTPDRRHTYKVFLDFADLSRSAIYVDRAAVATTVVAGMVGSAVWDTTGCQVRIAQTYAGTVTGAEIVANLRIDPQEW